VPLSGRARLLADARTEQRLDPELHNDHLAPHEGGVGAGPPLDWRLLANGYLVDLAYECGTVNTGIGIEELKRRSNITLRVRAAGGCEDFSQLIREGSSPRPPQGSQSAVAQAP
jgi:hypothetical protein